MNNFKVCVRVNNEPRTVTIMGATSQREARKRAYDMAMANDPTLLSSQIRIGVAYQARRQR